MGNEGKNGKVPLISKIAYGFGDVGCNFSWMFVSNFLMIFYTDVFGISMAAGASASAALTGSATIIMRICARTIRTGNS